MLNLCFFHYSLALYTIYPTNIAWEFIVGWNNFLSSKIHETSGWLGFNVLCSAAVEPRLSRLQVCVVCVTDATVLAYLIQPGSANFTSVSCSFLLRNSAFSWHPKPQFSRLSGLRNAWGRGISRICEQCETNFWSGLEDTCKCNSFSCMFHT